MLDSFLRLSYYDREIMIQTAKTKILLIGWDAADWKIIHHLVDAGKMPHMAGVIEEGQYHVARAVFREAGAVPAVWYIKVETFAESPGGLFSPGGRRDRIELA